ncbi:MAG TPA: response regulator, partial [Pirellulales bacterium]|nr:response regulator [Pirellulales bacterium]
VEVCWTGSQALETAQAFRPEVVFLDIGLPDMDGWEVAAELRKRAEIADATIIAISAYQSDEDRRRSQAAGIDAHIGKPASKDDFAKVLADLAE